MMAAKTIRLGLSVFAAALLLGLLFGCQPAEVPPGPPTAAPTVAIAASATAVSGPVITPATPTPGECAPPPVGWQPYVIQPGDTLQELSARAGVSSARILSENCLPTDTLIAGETIYLPPLAAVTPCVAPADWEPVTIDIGDSLVSLAHARGVSVAEIEAANCLTSEAINAGERLYLPPLPTPTPCPVPAGWEAYTVQPGDTVLDLAAARNVTSAEIMAANCLAAPLVQPGQTIYLPPLPPPPPTDTATPIPPAVAPAPVAGPTQPPQAVAAAPQSGQASSPGGVEPVGAGPAVSVINGMGITAGVSSFDILPRLPDQPGFKECEGSDIAPDIDYLGEKLAEPLYLGQRRYFFTCFFEPITATLEYPDRNIHPLTIERDPAYPIAFGPFDNKDYFLTSLGTRQEGLPADVQEDFSKDPAAVIEWPALPGYATGVYTLTVTGVYTRLKDNALTVSQTIVVSPFVVAIPQPLSRSILVQPVFTVAQQPRMVYYTNYPLNSSPEFTVFYAEAITTQNRSATTWYRSDKTWPIIISEPLGQTGRGWGKNLVYPLPSDKPGLYLITSTNTAPVAAGLFWIKQGVQP